MGYSKKIYFAAHEELKRRKARAESEQKQHHDEVLLKCPELLKIEREMSAAGLEVVKALGMGADAQRFIDVLAQKNLTAQNERLALLRANGYPDDYLKVKYVCEKCCDTGYDGVYRCKCYDRLLTQLAYESLCRDLPIDKCSFANFKLDYYPKKIDEKTGVVPYNHMKSVLDFCKSYADDFDTLSPSLLMYGETGLGKTHLSLAIAAAAVEKGFDAVYGSAQNLLNKIESEHFSKGGADDDTAQLLNECDLLILDDLGAEFSTSFTVSVIYNIINTRQQRELPTIISTNLSIDELEKRYQQRVTSRIIGSFVTLAFCGGDVRQIKRRNRE